MNSRNHYIFMKKQQLSGPQTWAELSNVSNVQPMKHAHVSISNCNSRDLDFIMVTCMVWSPHGIQQSVKEIQNRTAQLIRAKTKPCSVLFACYSRDTMERGTIGRSFPGFREVLLSKELVRPQPRQWRSSTDGCRSLHYVVVNMRFSFIHTTCSLSIPWETGELILIVFHHEQHPGALHLCV